MKSPVGGHEIGAVLRRLEQQMAEFVSDSNSKHGRVIDPGIVRQAEDTGIYDGGVRLAGRPINANPRQLRCTRVGAATCIQRPKVNGPPPGQYQESGAGRTQSTQTTWTPAFSKIDPASFSASILIRFGMAASSRTRTVISIVSFAATTGEQ